MHWSPRTTTETVFASLTRELFDRPVMTGSARTLFVRHLVLAGLGDGFRRGARWDVERVDGIAIAIRQAAALEADPYAASRGATFLLDGAGDPAGEDGADLVILAWHGEANRSISDQRDPLQWRFAALPTGRIAHLAAVDWADLDALGATPVPFAALRDAARRALATPATAPVPTHAEPAHAMN